MSITNASTTTRQLSILPEPELKKMAIMHKNDFGMFSLIMAEDGRRKAIRAAAMAKMAGGPQPTIADQSISQMGQMPQQPMPPQGMPPQGMPPQGMPPQGMPPQAGIPALPAQNVQGLAGGGIVALAEGGMPDYGPMTNAQLISDNEPVIRMANGMMPKDDPNYNPDDQYIVNPDDDLGGGDDTEVSIVDNETGGSSAVRDYAAIMLKERLQKAKEEGAAKKAKAEADEANKPKPKFTMGPNYISGKKDDPSNFISNLEKERQLPSTAKPRSIKTPEVTPVAPVVAKAVKERVTDKKAPPPAAKKVVVTPPAALTKESSGIEELLPKLGGKTTEDIAKDIAAAEKVSNKETDEFYRPEREKLQQEREAIDNRGSSNFANALTRFGLVMAAGKSPYAIQNAAEGATQGLNAYQEAQKLDNAARQANQQSRMLMIQAQRSERIGNKREAVAASNQSRQFQQAENIISQQSDTLKNTREYQQGQLEVLRKNAETAAQNANTNAARAKAYAGKGAGAGPESMQLKTLQAQAKILQATAGDLTKSAKDRAVAQASLDGINTRMRALEYRLTGGDDTMLQEPSPSAGDGQFKVIGVR